MPLNDLNENLHSRDFHDRRGGQIPYDPRTLAQKEGAHPEFSQTEKWQEPAPPEPVVRTPGFFSRLSERQRYALIGGGIALFLLVIGLGVFFMRGKFFNEERIHIGIQGPTSVPSAEPASFTFTYQNDNWSAMENVVLSLSYPETFKLEAANAQINRLQAEVRLGNIGGREEGTYPFSGTFEGFQGGLVYLKATLRYNPAGLTGSFTKEVQVPIEVTASPLILEVAAPQEVASGQEVAYVIDYRNEDDKSYSDMRLQMEYPAGFRFLESDPRPSEGENIWYLGTLSSGQSGKIIIRGAVSGEQNESKKVRALLGRTEASGEFVVLNTRERETRIQTSPLAITQSVNGLVNVTVNAGDQLNYELVFRNTGTVGLRDAIITLELDSPYLDYSQLALPSGAYDAGRKMIVWKASDLPALSIVEPGETGEIHFTIPVLRTFTLENNDKNIFIESVAKIDSVDLPTPIGQNKIIGSNTLIVKVNSLVTPTLRAFYYDQTFPNSGPLPPVVGQETTYTIRLKLATTPNDITRARLLLALPAGVTYKNKSSPESERLVWNERANELAWELGTLTPGKDREIIFQIGATPGPNNVGKEVILINGGTLTGLDSYTKEEVKVTIDRKENYIPEDAEAAKAGNEVRASE